MHTIFFWDFFANFPEILFFRASICIFLAISFRNFYDSFSQFLREFFGNFFWIIGSSCEIFFFFWDFFANFLRNIFFSGVYLYISCRRNLQNSFVDSFRNSYDFSANFFVNSSCEIFFKNSVFLFTTISSKVSQANIFEVIREIYLNNLPSILS